MVGIQIILYNVIGVYNMLTVSPEEELARFKKERCPPYGTTITPRTLRYRQVVTVGIQSIRQINLFKDY